MIYNIETLWLRRTALVIVAPFAVMLDFSVGVLCAAQETYQRAVEYIPDAWRKR